MDMDKFGVIIIEFQLQAMEINQIAASSIMKDSTVQFMLQMINVIRYVIVILLFMFLY